MKLDKRHMTASLALLVLAVAYNIYVYMGPSSATRGRAAGRVDPLPMDTGTPPSTGPAEIDPTTLPPVPDVEIDRLPVWGNTPFADVRPLAPPAAATDQQPEVQTEPDVVVAAILMAANRRVAMVNGKIVRPGDKIGVITVVDITPDSVVVDSPTRGRLTVPMKAPHSEVAK